MTFELQKPRVAVKVEKKGRKLYVIPDEIHFLKPGTLLMKCPYEVVGPDGEKIEPVGQFVMTAETIDPYHMVTDWFNSEEKAWE